MMGRLYYGLRRGKANPVVIKDKRRHEAGVRGAESGKSYRAHSPSLVLPMPWPDPLFWEIDGGMVT